MIDLNKRVYYENEVMFRREFPGMYVCVFGAEASHPLYVVGDTLTDVLRNGDQVGMTKNAFCIHTSGPIPMTTTIPY